MTRLAEIACDKSHDSRRPSCKLKVVSRNGNHETAIMNPPKEKHTWTFLTNHAHVLVCLYRDPAVRLREVALEVGITERAVQRIVSELEEFGAIRRERDGRRNAYVLDLAKPLRHPIESHRTVADLIEMVGSPVSSDPTPLPDSPDTD
jgi:predicted DNA-binding transcriptional regulator